MISIIKERNRESGVNPGQTRCCKFFDYYKSNRIFTKSTELITTWEGVKNDKNKSEYLPKIIVSIKLSRDRAKETLKYYFCAVKL